MEVVTKLNTSLFRDKLRQLWLSVEVIAEELGVSYATVHRWLKQKDIPKTADMLAVCALFNRMEPNVHPFAQDTKDRLGLLIVSVRSVPKLRVPEPVF